MITEISSALPLVDSVFFRLVVIPFLIFFAKVVDVGLSTIGLIFTARGYKKLAVATSFLEIIIYLLAISAILNHLSEWYYLFAYATGYTVGTYVGMWLEEKLSIGFLSVRFITRKNPERLLKGLRRAGYQPTSSHARSSGYRVHVVHVVVKRRELADLADRLTRFDRSGFYAVEDIRWVNPQAIEESSRKAIGASFS